MNIPHFAAQLALKDNKVLNKLVQQADAEAARALDRLPARGPRFTHKFVNGAHVVFDNRFYCNAEVFQTAKAVAEALR
jgi:hypothetical protein